ncbi:MAG: MEKHLA domain-containing protein [Deltaproteobacteria bacterium]|nr:MEKHLA domain-containing protein [Deltaproteobacteria bacterium]
MTGSPDRFSTMDLAWIRWLLDSHALWLKQELIDRSGDIEEQSERLFLAPFAVMSHVGSDDPVLNYGNRQALELWGMTWDEFTATPSRLTAEPGNRDERARMLRLVTTHGSVSDYRGVRISRTGRRFLAEHATVWNVVDEDRGRRRQAAAFPQWTLLG